MSDLILGEYASRQPVATGQLEDRAHALPMFRQSEMGICSCCHPVRSRCIVTLDPQGREQYTCPKTRITARYFEGLHPTRRDEIWSTYLFGHLVMQ